MQKLQRNSIAFVLLFVVAVIAMEAYCRLGLGLGTPPIYQVGSGYEYRLAPNQYLWRFHNRYDVNAQGLRSGPIEAIPRPSVVRVLCLGDSITNGGTQTDQSVTYPYQLEKILNQTHRQHFQVLNASAGGWAPANELGFVKQFGIFHSQIVVWELGTNDIFQADAILTPSMIKTSFPTHRPVLALQEALFRYLPEKLFHQAPVADPGVKIIRNEQQAATNRQMIIEMRDLVIKNGGKLCVLYMQQPDETQPTDPEMLQAESKFYDTLKGANVKYYCPASDFRAAGGKKLFRDNLHPNAQGDKVEASAAMSLVDNLIRVN